MFPPPRGDSDPRLEPPLFLFDPPDPLEPPCDPPDPFDPPCDPLRDPAADVADCLLSGWVSGLALFGFGFYKGIKVKISFIVKKYLLCSNKKFVLTIIPIEKKYFR